MKVETLAEILHEHSFAQEFQPHHLDMLTELARDVHFDKDWIIFREGDECGTFYLIVSGRVALELKGPHRTFLIQTLGAGDELGWSSVLMSDGRHFQARALEPVWALAFDGTRLLQTCKDDPTFGYALMYRLLGVVSKRLQATRLQLMDLYAR
jgi:CRP/FNR family transcriptional regulator, cyclic AMP receptor protein